MDFLGFYTSSEPDSPETGWVALLLLLLIGVGWAVAYKRGHKADQEEEARIARIKAVRQPGRRR